MPIYRTMEFKKIVIEKHPQYMGRYEMVFIEPINKFLLIDWSKLTGKIIDM